MKQITRFVCEKCGASFPSEAEALSCEKYHIPVDGIVSVDYVCKASGRGLYPRSFMIRMQDGKVRRYEYDGHS